MLCHRLAQNISQLYQAKNKKKKKRLLVSNQSGIVVLMIKGKN